MTSFNREKAAPLAIAVSASVLAAVTAAAFLVGSSSVSLGDLVAWATGGDVSASAKSILVNVRLPRVLAALLAGGALAVAGAIIQAVLDNPLASPNIIGINSGAGLFVLIAASVFPSALWLPSARGICGRVGHGAHHLRHLAGAPARRGSPWCWRASPSRRCSVRA